MAGTVLIVDDEQGIRFSLQGILEDEGHEVVEAETGESGLAALSDGDLPDLVFLDIWLPGMDGLSVLEKIRETHEDLPVIMISGHGNIETAVKALKSGAFDFIEKPLSLEKVVAATRNALEFSRLRQENRALRSRISDQPVRLTGESPAIRGMRDAIDRVGPTDAWVLITGENGTGKEIVARSIHHQSHRSDRPLIAVNCAAIPEELIESELFGHEKGAFTGADKPQEGKFELADNGTLFLDEIGDMSLKTQAKILRILQEQSFERVGGRKTIKVDVRVVAATNKNLEEEIRAGNFREDLYYRLKVFPLEIPPLRDRAGDIPLLIEAFMASLIKQHGFKPLGFDDEALQVLTAYRWPGNVRELKNFVERMFIMYAGEAVTPAKLPPEFGAISSTVPAFAEADPDCEAAQPDTFPAGPVDLKQARAEFEARFLEAKLREFDGNVSQLAKAVGLERSSLYRKLKAYNIQAD